MQSTSADVLERRERLASAALNRQRQGDQPPTSGNVQAGSSARGAAVGDFNEKPDSYEWSARIRCNDSELGDGFSVYIFLGSVPENPSGWDEAPSCVGSQGFMSSSYGAGSYGAIDTRIPVQGFIHLTDFIDERSGLSSLREEVVVPYLKENIHWRTQLMNGTVVPSTNFSSLEVVVIGTPYSQGPGDPFPRAGTVREYPDVTAGRPGGYRSR